MKKVITFIITFFLLWLFFIPVCAHSGNTDGKGGHYDQETGQYHYHHGYSAHLHPDGICPYKNAQNVSSFTEESNDKDFAIVLFFIIFLIFSPVLLLFLFRNKINQTVNKKGDT